MADETVNGCRNLETGLIEFTRNDITSYGCINWDTGYVNVTINNIDYNACMNWETGFFEAVIIQEIGQWTRLSVGSDFIDSAVSHDNKLYGTNNDFGLFVWDIDKEDWIRLIDNDAEKRIDNLISYNGKIYGSSGGGTGFKGKLYEATYPYTSWVEVADVIGTGDATVNDLIVYDNKIYGGMRGAQEQSSFLWEWNGTNAWVQVAPAMTPNAYTRALEEYDGQIFSGTGTDADLFVWNGTDDWVKKASGINSVRIVEDMKAYDDGSGEKLYGVTTQFSNGNIHYLFRWNDVDAWENLGTTNENCYNMLVKNEKLYYAGQKGRLYKYNNNTQASDIVADQYAGDTWIRTLTEFKNEIYGTNNSGRIFRYDIEETITGQLLEVADSDESSLNTIFLYDDKMYIGTTDNAKLLEYDGDSLTEVADQYGTETWIMSMVSHDDGNGVALYGSTNGGLLLKWDGIDTWDLAAPQYLSQGSIPSIIVFNDGTGAAIYGGTSNSSKLFKWNDSNAWTQVSDTYSSEISAGRLVEYNGEIYCGTAPRCLLIKSDGSSAWSLVAAQHESETAISEIITFDNGDGLAIYGVTIQNGYLLKWKTGDGATWTEVAGPYDGGNRLESLVEYRGELYAGRRTGQLLKWNGADAWELVATDSNIGDINTLVRYNEHLYAGTSNEGKLYKLI